VAEAETRLTPAQAARRLDVTPAMIRWWTRHGQLDYELTPLGRLIDSASVERLRAERARAAERRADASSPDTTEVR
jgi:predicted site-specific integrase-resolvase